MRTQYNYLKTSNFFKAFIVSKKSKKLQSTIRLLYINGNLFQEF